MANQKNQAIVEEACGLHVKLIEFATNAGWITHTLTDISSITEQTWLNRNWLYKRLGQLVSLIRQTPAVLSGHGPIPPNNAILPLAGEAVDVEALWDLLGEVKAIRQKLPERTEAAGWCKAVESWAPITDCEATSFDEGYDGSKLVSYLEKETKDTDSEFGTLERLETALREDVDAVEWLDRLYRLLKDDSLEDIIRERHIVLDQVGHLDKLSVSIATTTSTTS